MTWLRKFRPPLFVLGGLLLIGSLLGGRLLTHGSGGGTEPAGKTTLPAHAPDTPGTIFLGFVDSDPPPVSHGLPPVLQSGEVEKVFVNTGDEVKVRTFVLWGRTVRVGDPLYKFNTTLQEDDLKQARQVVEVARVKVRQAKALEQQHKTKIALQKQKLAGAELRVNRTQEGYHVYYRNLRAAKEDQFGRDKKELIEQAMKDDPKLFELETAYLTAERERDVEKATLDALETTDIGAAVAEAEAEVKRYQTVADKADTAVELCTVRAKVAGTVERVNISPGDTLGISTRIPAVILVPAGPRVVRAEVEADFAHKVGPDKKGKEVTIYDNSDAKLTYTGVVRQIGTTFLPKRSTGDGFIQNETRVLEVVVDVPDPNPPGKPPLRVGQRVRVKFGQ
ncbi:MAG: hypothetical protein JWO38_3700 [Gemmataceae bacterium]|nr:hypothetical protein [Gemmataceae bacterium]